MDEVAERDDGACEPAQGWCAKGELAGEPEHLAAPSALAFVSGCVPDEREAFDEHDGGANLDPHAATSSTWMTQATRSETP